MKEHLSQEGTLTTNHTLMKIRKSELKNIIDKGWQERRVLNKERSAKNSQATKEWKLRSSKAEYLLRRLEKSQKPEDQADAYILKQLLKMITYNF